MARGKAVDPSALPYRPCVGVVLIDRRGLVFVGERGDMRGAWQMPQGGIDRGEDPREACLREMEEEIGTRKATILAETRDWLTYDLPPELVGTVWKGRYRGQRQKWFALRFTGRDADIALDRHKHREFVAWRWARPDELAGLTVAFKRPVYEAVVREFRPYFARAE